VLCWDLSLAICAKGDSASDDEGSDGEDDGEEAQKKAPPAKKAKVEKATPVKAEASPSKAKPAVKKEAAVRDAWSTHTARVSRRCRASDRMTTRTHSTTCLSPRWCDASARARDIALTQRGAPQAKKVLAASAGRGCFVVGIVAGGAPDRARAAGQKGGVTPARGCGLLNLSSIIVCARGGVQSGPRCLVPWCALAVPQSLQSLHGARTTLRRQ
jgi:hypothetical protein